MRILILLLCLLCLDLNAQTVIDYSNVSGTTCLFTTNTNVAATVNGSTNITVVHRVTVGQVDKDATNGAVAFQGISNSSGTLGSEYRIEYDFKQNYTYSIVVSAFSVDNTSCSSHATIEINQHNKHYIILQWLSDDR